MPNYVFTGPVPMIFGGFKYGDGITVAGVTDKDGQTVVLTPNDSVVSQIAIDHAYLVLMPESPTKKSSDSSEPVSEVPVESVVETPVILDPTAVEPIAETATDSLSKE